MVSPNERLHNEHSENVTIEELNDVDYRAALNLIPQQQRSKSDTTQKCKKHIDQVSRKILEESQQASRIQCVIKYIDISIKISLKFNISGKC